MRGVILAAALLPLLLRSSFADPLADALSRREKAHQEPVSILKDESVSPALAAVLLQDDRGRQTLALYALSGGKAAAIFETSPGGRLEFDSSQGKDVFPDLFGDASRGLLYNEWSADGRRRTLHVLRVQKGRAKEVGVYAEGEVKRLGGGGVDVVASRFPLDGLSPKGCAAFLDLGASARKTEVFAWTGRRFSAADRRFPGFFDENARLDEAALEGLDQSAHPAEYLAAALTLYFDRAAKGDKRRGWEGVSAVLKSTAKSLPDQADCAAKVRREIRSRLSIPDDWP